MAKDQIRLTRVFPVDAQRIYDAWLDSAKHTAFTGGAAATVDPRVGGRHTAWDGYVEGEILELEPGRRIVKSWRSSDFPEGEGPSRLEVLLEPTEGGTLVTVLHSEIPEGEGTRFEEGWRDYYFTPMDAYFSGTVAAEPEQPAAVEPAPQKPAVKKPAIKKAAAKKAPVKKAAAKRPVKKAAAKRPVKKAAAKRPVKKAAAKKPVKKAAAKKPAKKAAAKKPASRKRSKG